MSRIHPQTIARHLAVGVATGALPTDIADDAENVVTMVDAGAPRRRVDGAVQALVSAAWIRAGRETASASKPKEIRAAITRLQGVAELEKQLGLAPVAAEPAEQPVPEPATAPEPPADPVAAEPAGFSTGWEA
ncbi:hypothetical protein [Tsukamurella soli]|uniref:hypothetical protein n=1 Tax=Tsukamurella soli TaxID=644556 RepID=UPI003612AB4B